MTVGTGHSAPRVEPEPSEPRRPDKKWKLILTGLVAVFVVLAGYDLASVPGPHGIGSLGPAAASSAAAPAGGHSGALSSSATPGPAARSLNVATVAAFGPAGPSDGDNPGIASRVLGSATGLPWYSQWYATPEFGNLRRGTGILLDMGKTVTVTGVRLVLGSEPGADVQLRVGDRPDLTGLIPVADAADAGGGAGRLTATTPAAGRYVLIWFTRLPSDGHGHYQVSVYRVAVDGREPASGSG